MSALLPRSATYRLVVGNNMKKENMDKCFVIQPFDNDKFDKRYQDIFKPAIDKAELDPYRVDKDLSVRIPIDDYPFLVVISESSWRNLV